MSEKIRKTDEELRAALTPEQYHVTQEKGTERPFTGKYNDHHETGVYRCVVCGNELFTSDVAVPPLLAAATYCFIQSAPRILLAISTTM